MKKLWITLTCILVACYATAQSGISGIVSDAETKAPLPGANIVLQGTGKGTVSNQAGRFALDNVQPGPYQLIISYLGFTTQSLDIEAPAENLEISLNPVSLLTEEFIVSATRASETTPTTFQT